MAPRIQISSMDSYIDEEVTIRIIGCEKNTKVTLHATTYDEEQKKFCSYAAFVADHEGNVNVSSQSPIEGTYDQADSFGLFWSMEHADSGMDDYYEKSSAEKVSINLVLKVDEKEYDTVTIHRYFYMNGVKKEAVQHGQVRGVLFHPEQLGCYPAVIILSGSDGGMQEHAAGLLASKGYTAFALSYFGAEGVPKYLENIPLEYFQEAAMWLKAHPYVNGEVSLIGHSRGAELALLLGATFDDFKSVIAVAPSAYITPGMKNGIFANISSWVFNEKALPNVKFTYRPTTMFSILKKWILRNPVSFLAIWDNTLKNKEGLKEARIPVEKINSPVMLISGEDDHLWPSDRYVQMIKNKLKYTKGADKHRYLTYENAGHFLSFPYSFVNLPANVHMNTGAMTITFGGSKSANAQAAKDSWSQILDFLDRNMGHATIVRKK